jgi:hypothetical protein
VAVPLDRSRLALLIALSLTGAAGLAPGASGSLDAATQLGWIGLAAPAAGALTGGAGIAFFPSALVVPSAWLALLALAQGAGPAPLATPGWAACAVVGTFGLGHAAGTLAREPARCAGLLAFLALALAGLAVGGGVLAGGAELARAHPRAAAGLLDLSPLVILFDCAGRDWTHSHAEVYDRAGVEWFQRRPYRGELAGPAVLVVGCTLAWLARGRPSRAGGAEGQPNRPWPCASTSARSPRS